MERRTKTENGRIRNREAVGEEGTRGTKKTRQTDRQTRVLETQWREKGLGLGAGGGGWGEGGR